MAVTPAFHWNKKHWSDVYYEQFPTKLYMNKVRITAIRQTVYPDLIAERHSPHFI